MKILIPLFVFLAACKPPPPDLSGIQAELAALHQKIDTLKAANQPRLDAVEAMDDLAREVKQLKQKMAAPPPPAPALPAAPVLPALKGGDLTGAADANRYWVLTRVQVDGAERTVLCLYKAEERGFQLDAVRMLNADFQLIQYNSTRPSVQEVLKELEKTKK